MLNKFLKDNKIIILIPTYNRVGKQKTIKNFPTDCLGDSVFLVHSKEEIHEYPGIICPSEIDNIKDKRNFLIDYAQENKYDYMIQIDDDGYFRKFDENNKLNQKLEEQDYIDFLKMGMNYDYFSLGGYYFNLGDRGLEEDTLGVSFHMFRLSKLGDIRARVYVYEDVDLIYQVKDAGGKVATLHNIVFKNDNQTKGGNEDSENFTKDEIFDRRIDELISFHPTRIKKIPSERKFRNKYRGYILRFLTKDKKKKEFDQNWFDVFE